MHELRQSLQRLAAPIVVKVTIVALLIFFTLCLSTGFSIVSFHLVYRWLVPPSLQNEFPLHLDFSVSQPNATVLLNSEQQWTSVFDWLIQPNSHSDSLQ